MVVAAQVMRLLIGYCLELGCVHSMRPCRPHEVRHVLLRRHTISGSGHGGRHHGVVLRVLSAASPRTTLNLQIKKKAFQSKAHHPLAHRSQILTTFWGGGTQALLPRSFQQSFPAGPSGRVPGPSLPADPSSSPSQLVLLGEGVPGPSFTGPS